MSSHRSRSSSDGHEDGALNRAATGAAAALSFSSTRARGNDSAGGAGAGSTDADATSSSLGRRRSGTPASKRSPSRVAVSSRSPPVARALLLAVQAVGCCEAARVLGLGLLLSGGAMARAARRNRLRRVWLPRVAAAGVGGEASLRTVAPLPGEVEEAGAAAAGADAAATAACGWTGHATADSSSDTSVDTRDSG